MIFNSDIDVVVVANGLFPQKKELIDIIRSAPLLVCCDGASSTLMLHGIKPHYIVGDLDSISPTIKNEWSDLIIHIPDQDSNDLTKAVEFAVKKSCKNMIILGAGGLREDHALANISLLHYYLPKLEHVTMISDFGVFTPIVTTTAFKAWKGQQVSIFSMSYDCVISTKGLKYEIQSRKLSSWWKGTLNEAEDDTFTIELETDGRIIVYQCFDP
jgi:thiamine pyrophosphokinase